MPRFALLLILSAVYAGIMISVSGVQPKNGFPWWFFAPGMLAMLASLIARTVLLTMPGPWTKGNTGGDPPRAVQLSWNAVVGLPVYVPVLFLGWYFLAITRLHFDVPLVTFAIAMILCAIFLNGLLKSLREFALLRDGSVTEAIIERADRDRYGSFKIWYRFDTPSRSGVEGKAYHPGPVPELGRTMPVYFDIGDPRRHVIAGASWFEAA